MLVIWEILKGIKYFNAAGKDSFHLCDRNPIVCDWDILIFGTGEPVFYLTVVEHTATAVDDQLIWG